MPNPNFNYKNLIFNNGNANVTSLTQNIQSDVLTPRMYETTGFDSFVFTGTVAATTQPSVSTYASASKVTSSGGSILFTKTTATGYGFGLIVQFSTSSALPTGIAASTNYFVVPIDALTFKVATTYANALNGVYVAYTDTGTGTQTATPTALVGCTVFLQGSNDYGNATTPTWFTVPFSTTTVTVDATINLPFPNVNFANYRAAVAITSGQITFSALQIGYKGAV